MDGLWLAERIELVSHACGQWSLGCSDGTAWPAAQRQAS
jgi:hypothetical protein